MPSSILIQGAQGPQGPVGPQGPIGLTGPAGSSGLQNAVFITSNTTWTCPQGVTKVWVSMIGGGGGGTGLYNGGAYQGGGGGSGYSVTLKSITVTPGENINITIGTGGVGGDYGVNNGYAGAGTVTSFGAYLSVNGGGAASLVLSKGGQGSSNGESAGVYNAFPLYGGIGSFNGYGNGGTAYNGYGSAGTAGCCIIMY